LGKPSQGSEFHLERKKKNQLITISSI